MRVPGRARRAASARARTVPGPVVALRHASWEPAEAAVVRTGALPFHWLDDLAAPAVTAAARAVAAAGPGAEETAGGAGFAAAYDEACARTATALRERFRRTPILCDALLLADPAAHARLTAAGGPLGAGGPPDAADPLDAVDPLVAALRRTCARSGAACHFGPFSTARLDSASSGIAWGEVPPHRRTVLASWAVRAVAARAGEDPDCWPILRPRRAPGASVERDMLRAVALHRPGPGRDVRAVVQVRRPVRLTPRQRLLVDLCTGELPLRRIAELVAQHADDPSAGVATVHAELRQLAALGAVVLGPELTYGVDDPLRSLADWLGELPEGSAWRRRCAELAAAVDALAAAPAGRRAAALAALEATVARVAGMPAVPPPPGTAGGVFREHCTATVHAVTVGHPVCDGFRDDLRVLYDLSLLRPRWRLSAERTLLSDWFRGRFAHDAAVPVPEYLAAFLEDLDALEGGYRGIDARIATIDEAMEQVLLPPDGSPVRVHRVSRDAVDALVHRYGVDEPAVCNPEVMVAARSARAIAAGAYQLVLAGLHVAEDHLGHGPSATDVDAAFPGYRHETVWRYEALLDPGERLADVTQVHRDGTSGRIELPCVDIEVYDRSGRPRADVRTLGQLTVRRSGGRLRLTSRDGERYRLVAPPLARPALPRDPFSVFAFPTGCGPVLGAGRPHVPRVEVANAVLQRERWHVPAGELAVAGTDHRRAFVRCQRLRASLRLPRRLVARRPGGGPLYCDLDSPLLVRGLVGLAAATDPAAPLELTELLPAPEQLWLNGRVAEFRYVVFSAPPAGAGPAGGPR